MSTTIHESSILIFENGLPKQQKRVARGAKWKENPRKPKKGARWRDILKQDFGQLNEDRLYGTLAPMKPPCEARK